jgi:hypothetical protein
MRAAVLLIAAAASLALAAPAQAVPQWLAPVDVAGPSGVNVSGDLAVAPDGTTLAVATEFVGGFARVRARLRRPGEGFGPFLELSPADKQAGGPSVAVDQQGNFTVAFNVNDPLSQVRAARLPAGAGAFEPVETVSFGSDAGAPVVAVGGNGTAVIAYGQGNVIMAAIRQGPSGEFGVATMLSDPNPDFNFFDVAVDDSGNAIAVWSRNNGAGADVVEASERPAGLGFPPPGMALPVSSTTAGDHSTQPALAMAPDGRVVVLWRFQQGMGSFDVRYVERQPNGVWGSQQLASKPGEAAHSPDVAIAANGTAVGSWFANVGGNDLLQAGVRPPGGAFGGYRNFAATTVGVPDVEGNRAGEAQVAWSGFMAEGVFSVRRPPGGDFGSVDTVALGTQGSAMPSIALNRQALGLDDQGNATLLYQKATNPGGVFQYSLHAASYDAAPPRLDAVSVPGSGTPRAAIGMAAAASDRLSVPAITWSFGDGTSASGPAVSHAYGAPGAYSVTVTATDSAGNSTSASRSVLIVAAGGPPRITSKVLVLWGLDGRRIYLLRMKITKVPKGGKAQLRCKGKKCPFKRITSKKRRKRAITLFKEIKPAKVVGKKKRSFRAGQRLELRITAPGYIGKVVRYKLKKGKIPSGRILCLPEGAKKPRRNC